MRHLSPSQILFVLGRYEQLAQEWNDELASHHPNWRRLAEIDDSLQLFELLWEVRR